jgi:hypothetical protein
VPIVILVGMCALAHMANFLESHDPWALLVVVISIFILRVCGMSEGQVRKGVLWTMASLKFLIRISWLEFVLRGYASFSMLFLSFLPTLSRRSKSEFPNQ